MDHKLEELTHIFCFKKVNYRTKFVVSSYVTKYETVTFSGFNHLNQAFMSKKERNASNFSASSSRCHASAASLKGQEEKADFSRMGESWGETIQEDMRFISFHRQETDLNTAETSWNMLKLETRKLLGSCLKNHQNPSKSKIHQNPTYKHVACCAASCARYGTAKAAAETAGRAAVVVTGMKRRATWWDEVRDDYTTIIVIITKL